MPQYVAFLRAINVGGHVVRMDALRKLFEKMGFSKVETFIASGNVIFESRSKSTAALEKKIEAGLAKALGYPVASFVRTIGELAAVAARQPFKAAAEDSKLYVAFVHELPQKAAQARLNAVSPQTDEFHFQGRELYWLIRSSFHESPLSGALLEKTIGGPATTRNINTVRKLAEKYGKASMALP